MYLDIISNGLGSQSIYLMYLASLGRIPAKVSISADTGSELDRRLNTGEKISNQEYFDRIVKPLASRWGIDARFVRARDKDGVDLPSLFESAKLMRGTAEFGAQHMPLFSIQRNVKGRFSRLPQTCTDRWKIAAIKQEARRMGATKLRSAQGIHFGEASRRISGRYKGAFDFQEYKYNEYQTGIKNRKTGEWRLIKWMTHYYPLIDLRIGRRDTREQLEKLDIPFLESSECDQCPHKDLPRWLRTSPKRLDEIADLESQYNGKYFFTEKRVPLKEAIRIMQAEAEASPSLFKDTDFGCGNSYCGV